MINKDNMKSVLNTIVGTESYKKFPNSFKKGEVGVYNKDGQVYLYLCTKDRNNVSLPNKDNFKPLNLRDHNSFLEETVVPNMLDIYKWMYEIGLNGWNIDNRWGVQNNRHYKRMSLNVPLELRVYYGSDSREIEDLENEYNFKDRARRINEAREDFLKHINLKEIVVNQENYSNTFFTIDGLYQYSNMYHVHWSQFKPVVKEDGYSVLTRKYKSNAIYDFGVCKYNKNENYDKKSADYKWRKNALYDRHSNLKFDTFDKEMVFRFYTDSSSSESCSGEGDDRSCTTDYSYYYNINYERDVYYLTKFMDKGTFDFFRPFFTDISHRNSGRHSFIELTRDNQDDGFYFKLKRDGFYEIEFYIISTTRDQHEEKWNGDFYGNRYAYVPLPGYERVRTNETYCEFQEHLKYKAKFKIQVKNRKIVKVELIVSDDKKDYSSYIAYKEHGLFEKFANNHFYFQHFYSCYSYDDSGSWNEWQFAAIVPPFNIKYSLKEE